MRPLRTLVTLAGCVVVLSGCVTIVEDVDPHLTLPDAKKYTQEIEREIAGALPAELLLDVEQKETGVFLPCSRDGGEQWAGGLTAHVQSGADAALVLDPVEKQLATKQGLALNRREDDEDFILDIVGHHHSAWVVRYDTETGEVYVTSFSPCIRLPEGVWRGDRY